MRVPVHESILLARINEEKRKAKERNDRLRKGIEMMNAFNKSNAEMQKTWMQKPPTQKNPVARLPSSGYSAPGVTSFSNKSTEIPAHELLSSSSGLSHQKQISNSTTTMKLNFPADIPTSSKFEKRLKSIKSTRSPDFQMKFPSSSSRRKVSGSKNGPDSSVDKTIPADPLTFHPNNSPFLIPSFFSFPFVHKFRFSDGLDPTQKNVQLSFSSFYCPSSDIEYLHTRLKAACE